ncbi:MAG: hypothetical protein L6R48_10810 [Planctomycetes bacterium]|nr:hypothetical protein [Planctomycetota bacterium]
MGISAHFVVVLRTWDNGNLMLAPITSKGSRCQLSVRLTSLQFPSLFGAGGLTIEGSHLSLRDDRGNTTIFAWPADSGALIPVNGKPIPIDRRALLTQSEFTILLATLPDTLRQRVQA